jgi:hypothetical protein
MNGFDAIDRLHYTIIGILNGHANQLATGILIVRNQHCFHLRSPAESDSEPAAFAWLTLNPDSTAVRFDQAARDRQTEARAFPQGGVGTGHLMKIVEDRILLFLRDARSGIGD